MTKDELLSLIRDHTFYKGMAKVTGGGDPNSSNYAHHRRIMDMCDKKIEEYTRKLKDLKCHITE